MSDWLFRMLFPRRAIDMQIQAYDLDFMRKKVALLEQELKLVYTGRW